MEISGNRINPYQLPSPERRDNGKVSPGRRYNDGKDVTESRTEGPGGLSEFISRGEVIRERARLCGDAAAGAPGTGLWREPGTCL